MVAICNCKDTCLGLRLVGVESYFATTEEELLATLLNLLVADIKILVVSEELAAADSFVNFEMANPQIIAIRI